MDHNAEKNNKVYLMGEIVSEAVFSHEVYGEGFYEFYVKVMRLSGQADILPVTISERLIEGNDLPSYYEAQISSPRPDAACTTSYIVCFGCVVTRTKDGWRVTINGNTIPVDRFAVCGDRIVFHREGSA